MFGWIKKIFGTAQTRKVSRFRKTVKLINSYEEQLQKLSDDDVKAKTQEFKKRYADGETLDSLLPEAYAVVKNACRRLCGTDIHVSGYKQQWDMIPYDVQLVGAIAMHTGAIAEMHTGEGKNTHRISSSLPARHHGKICAPCHRQRLPRPTRLRLGRLNFSLAWPTR